MRGRTIRTPKKRAALLASIEAHAGNVTRACKAVRIARQSVWEWARDDEDFKAALDAAIDRGADLLEEEAIRRAREGTKKPVYQGGKLVGYVQEYSDTLLMFLLNGKRPERYKHRQELTGKDGKPLVGSVVPVLNITLTRSNG